MTGDWFRVRPARQADAAFLVAMGVAAVNWTGDRDISGEWFVTQPKLAHYVEGWPRAGDVGVIAETAEGVPIGAAWARCFPAHDPGYGWVAADIPELSMAVADGYRGRGVGSALLTELVATIRGSGGTALSLSVEPSNPAIRLYLRFGFVEVASDSDAITMRLDL